MDKTNTAATAYETQQDIYRAVNALKATLPWEVKTALATAPRSSDSVRDGQIVTRWGVDLRLSAMGSGETRTIWCGEAVDLAAIVEEMRAALAKRNKQTRGAIRRERSRS